jgi:hypothetical protein
VPPGLTYGVGSEEQGPVGSTTDTVVVTVDATTVGVTVDGTREMQEQALERRTGRGVEVARGNVGWNGWCREC